jgi:hypothetical protein
VLIALGKPIDVIWTFRLEPGRRALAGYINVPNVYSADRLSSRWPARL